MFTSKIREARAFACVSPKIYDLGWQDPLIGQFAHPHPQEDFPFFLSRTIPTIIAATTAINIAQMITVAIFSPSHASIPIPPVLSEYYFDTFTVLVNLVDSLYGLKIIYSMNARTTIAAIRPMICRLPVKAEPN